MGRGLLPVPLCALLRHAGVGSREQVQTPFPLPRRRPFWGGGRLPGSGGAEGRACGSPAGVGAGGGGGGGAAPPPALGPVWEGGGSGGVGVGVAGPDDIGSSLKPHAPTVGGRSQSSTREAPHPRAPPRAVFLAGCFALCRAARCTPRTTCSCLATWCHHLVGFVPPLGGLCATTRWTLCHHLVGFVTPRGGLCATTRWTLCHHLVGFVPPRGGLCATTRWTLCHHLVGFVPPRGGLCATTRWTLCHHAVGFVLPCGGPRATTWWTRCFHALGFVPPRGGLAGCCRQPPPSYQTRGVEGAAPAARQVQPLCSSCCFPFHAAAHVV